MLNPISLENVSSNELVQISGGLNPVGVFVAGILAGMVFRSCSGLKQELDENGAPIGDDGLVSEPILR